MSDNEENEQESSSSEQGVDDLFLSPDDDAGEEIEFAGSPASGGGAPEAAAEPGASAPGVDPAILAELTAERDDYKNRMMRLAADLENFRKRTAREKDEMRKFGIDRVVLELLPVLDNLERALDHADKSEDSTTIVDGVRMVHRQFLTALEKHGVKPFESKGEMFDPQRHEAIQQMETADHPTGQVLEQFQKGYYLHERLIRPALVVVARNPSAEISTPPPDEHLHDGEDQALELSDAADESDESAVN